jgi:hypothetical protein
MSILNQLKNNKGTISSALGKELAEKVLRGNEDILKEAVELCNFEPDNISAKSVRAGAAKIVEKVAEKKPELVAPHLNNLLKSLDSPEPQTKWMLMMAFGHCVEKNPKLAEKAIPYANRYIDAKQGLGPVGAAEIFLGKIGSVSKKNANKVLPILLKAAEDPMTNEEDWIIEGFMNIFEKLDSADQKKIIQVSKNFKNAPKKSTLKRLKKLESLWSK